VHLTREQLESGLEPIRSAPKGEGRLDLIVCRPDLGERRELTEATIDPVIGLVGDNWSTRGSRHTPDGGPEPEHQITITSARALALIAGDRSRWPLAGDQLYVDLDLSTDALPIGAQLAIGSAVLEVSPAPHKGCAKYAARFGRDALRFVQSTTGRALRLRGLHAVVVEGGAVQLGDTVRSLWSAAPVSDLAGG
jgi:MOSC domain-containing protein YiiM